MRVLNALVHISPTHKDAHPPQKLVLMISLEKYRNIHVGNGLNELKNIKGIVHPEWK